MQEFKVIIQSHKERSIQRFHPWIFSGAIKSINGNPVDGDIVKVYSSKDEFLATGIYGTGSIAVRILAFEDISIDENFWKQRLKNAFALRKTLKLAEGSTTNIYRLVHGEGDQLPGLIIDVYGKVAIIQAHHAGMYHFRHQIAKTLIEIGGDEILSVYDKSSETLPAGISSGNEYLIGNGENAVSPIENGIPFIVDWQTGQKTGFFIDQRENRLLLATLSQGKKVLNTFCYTGGFSVYALKAGATVVHSVDSSQSAIDMCEKNVSLLDYFNGEHQSFKADAVHFVKELETDYDIIILDPPAFAKHVRARHNAIQAYKRLNAHAIRQIKPGGIIFTFSCSQVVDKDLFKGAIHAAAIETGRSVRILHQLHQPADHPVNIFHPESEYLKGLVIQVN
jgi:23S rRNA (cytosine1962-C5)-methyltransferase